MGATEQAKSVAGEVAPGQDRSRDRLVVSDVTVDGVRQPISMFGDSRWNFIEGATNIGRNSRFIDFDQVPGEFRAQFKAIMFSYYRNGRRSRARPTIMTLRMHYFTARQFFAHLQEEGVQSLEDATSGICLAFVEKLRSRRTRYGKALSPQSIEKALLTVELIHEVGREIGYAIPHPWPNTFAGALAGVARLSGPRTPKTPLIPDTVMSELFRAATNLVRNADRILDLRDALREQMVRRQGKEVRASFLWELGWEGGIADLRREVHDIRTACYVVVAALTGCRNHEIGHIKVGAYHRTVGDDGEEYWWLTSVSTKTRTGKAKWMISRAVVDALRVMERWSAPIRDEIREKIARLREHDPRDPDIAESQRHQDALFIGKSNREIATLSASRWCFVLKKFARRHAIDWPLATHQFRRTFAVYAAKSQFGDLRYLKEHFKHWSMDMTLLYAMGGLQERELLDEVAAELDLIREDVVLSWLDPATKLAGGGGRRVMSFRNSNPIPMYKSRKEMVGALSLGVHLRSNGHAWCTADDSAACLGNSGVDPARCAECSNAVISGEHAAYYQSLREDLRALLDEQDIGETGRWRVARDLARCDEVLHTIGIQP